jgi:hypothetical protein
MAIKTCFAPSLPREFAWLEDLGLLPQMLQQALPFYLLKEYPGPVNNPIIMGMAKELGIERVYTADSIAWCGLAHAYFAMLTGKDIAAVGGPKGGLWALNWAKWGTPAGQPGLGDTLVFSRTSGGHVGSYIGETQTDYIVFGANQGDIPSGTKADTIGFGKLAKNRLVAARKPPMILAPASRKPYVLTLNGERSTNEA